MGFRIASAFVILAIVVGFAVLRQLTASAEGSAVLTVYTGTVQVEKAGAADFSAAHSGDHVAAGDTVRSGPGTKALITYPNSSLVRLDSNTELTINRMARTGDRGWAIDLYQSSGKTWHRVTQLLGGSSYTVHAPNNTTAEVRGTEFEVIVGYADGVLTLRVDVNSGVVDVTANGGKVTLRTGESTTITPGQPPTPASPIPSADWSDSFTVFNQTADASGGKPVNLSNNRLSPPQSSAVQQGATADGKSDLEFTLGWPGSRFALTVFAPDGSVFQQAASDTPPVTIVAAKAQAGVWKYQVTDLESKPGEVWWVIVSVITPSRQTPVPFFTTKDCTHATSVGRVDTWSVAAEDSAGKPNVKVTGLPSYASSSGGRGNLTVQFSPPATADTATFRLTFSASLLGQSASLDCTERVLGAPSSSPQPSPSPESSPGPTPSPVPAAEVASIALEPVAASMTAGSSQAYSAEAFDQHGKSLGAVTASTVFTIAPDGSCTNANCTANIAGDHTVTGNFSGKSATAHLIVNPAGLASMTLDPATASITIGGSQPYTVQGRDQYANALGDMTGSTSFGISPDGSCTGPTCTANVPGAHTVTATNGLATATATLNVYAQPLAPSVASLGSSANPSVFGQPVTLTATVSGTSPGAPTPTGTVTFADGSTTLGTGTLSGGVAALSISSMGIGSNDLTAAYGGDSNFTGSVANLAQTVGQAAAATVLGASPEPSVLGQRVTLTATVSATPPATGNPSGTVTFRDGAANLGTFTVSGGSASYSTSSLAVGAHNLTADYSGDSHFAASSSGWTQTVNRGNAAVALAVPAIQYSDPVSITATVTAQAPATGTPTGTVTFMDGATTLGTSALSGGTANLSAAAASLGSHSITAAYNGDANFNPSTALGTLTVSPEDARSGYAGATTFTGTAGSTITARLSANLTDITACNFGPTSTIPCSPADNPSNDTSAGDIRTATLTFVDGFTGATLCTAAIATVNTAGPPPNTVATASCDWSVPVSSASAVYDIDIVVAGNYTAPLVDQFVVVSPPTPNNAIKAHNATIDQAGTPAGMCRLSAGSPIVITANVTYTLSGGVATNPSGSVVIGFVAANSCTPGQTSTPRKYDIKATSVTKVTRPPSAVNTVAATIDATTVTIIDETTPGTNNAISLAGTANFTVHVAVTDGSGASQASTIAVEIRDANGNLWFSSDWNGATTNQQPVGSGSLTVT